MSYELFHRLIQSVTNRVKAYEVGVVNTAGVPLMNSHRTLVLKPMVFMLTKRFFPSSQVLLTRGRPKIIFMALSLVEPRI